MMRWFCWLGSLMVAVSLAGAEKRIPQQFLQEMAHHHVRTNGLPPGPVQLVEVGPDSSPRAYVAGRWWRYGTDRWEWMFGVPEAPVGEFLFPDAGGGPLRLAVPASEVRQIVRRGDTNYVLTASSVWVVTANGATSLTVPQATLNQLALSSQGQLWLASSAGLHRWVGSSWEQVRASDGLGRIWGLENVLGVAFDSAGRVWMAARAGVGRQEGDHWVFFDGRDGLPWNDFTSITAARDGSMWFGTRLGAIRFDGREWQYRQGPRWLPNDEVTQIAVDVHGEAWFATKGGIGWIEHRPFTLAEKAVFYEKEIDQYIRRTPYGFVAEAALRVRGERSSANPDDSDNDGLWTAMYGAGECFAWAATRDPAAKARAKKAFEALRFLQVVTQGGQPSPPPGYVARTIVSTQLPDPNAGRLEGDRAFKAERDAMWKVYEPRWPKSADGAWYWKSDTSSDELDGHYFLYAQYFELCADTPEEKARVAEVVRGLTDHLLQHNFSLVDIDGTATRWGVYGPQALNHDPRWWWERGLNSLSMLSYLAVAEHVTGDPKYAQVARELIDRHGYEQNAMVPKMQAGVGSGNQSDDEMAFMCFYNLLRYSKDEALKARMRLSFHLFWALEEPEMNPFFNFAFAAVNQNQFITSQWGKFSVAPWPGWLEDSAATLRGFSLDRLNWSAKNSHRLDVVRLPRQNSIDLLEPDSRPRGWRNNQKVVPGGESGLQSLEHRPLDAGLRWQRWGTGGGNRVLVALLYGPLPRVYRDALSRNDSDPPRMDANER